MSQEIKNKIIEILKELPKHDRRIGVLTSKLSLGSYEIWRVRELVLELRNANLISYDAFGVIDLI